MTRRWYLLLLGAAVLGFGIYAYETAKPWVHPIKQADAVRLAALENKAAPQLVPAAEEPTPTQEWFGDAQAVDGDTLAFDGHEVHLWAVDAPELDQTCERAGKPWRCGDFAKAELEKLIGGRTVACRGEGPEQNAEHPTVLCFVRTARCAQDEACQTSLGSLNLAMVKRGAAMDIEGHFGEIEDDAQQARAGLWASSFKPPWEWRGVEAGH
ncbi:thermonuclease family protein [Sphingomonas montanisoli]|uniref:Thermonuclease family protein n=1 Tax=Sphingomonas montanisoli TaxID=2606412 RepID=A0A5D9CAG9_9SPHN|nr:thermonuclease family protein [Sphingomonas montanisoli]TZG28050.1 thermonuclease family protein [Sphingomonas montanisoli]